MASASTKLSQIRHHMSKQRIMHVSMEPAQFRQGRKKAQEHPHQLRSTNRTTHAPVMLWNLTSTDVARTSENHQRIHGNVTAPAPRQQAQNHQCIHRAGPAQAPQEQALNHPVPTELGQLRRHKSGHRIIQPGSHRSNQRVAHLFSDQNRFRRYSTKPVIAANGSQSFCEWTGEGPRRQIYVATGACATKLIQCGACLHR